MEKTLEKRLRLRIEAMGGKCIKFVSPGNAGVPDRICLMGGRVWFVEVKTEHGILSPLQKALHKIFEATGHTVWIIKDDFDLNRFINEIAPLSTPRH